MLFIDWLSAQGFDAWQILPLTPPDRFGSPYASPSAFAGWSELSHLEKHVDLNEETYWIEIVTYNGDVHTACCHTAQSSTCTASKNVYL